MTRINTDEWAAEAAERTRVRGGIAGRAQQAFEAVPLWARFWAFILLTASLPFLTDSSFVLRVGINALLFAMLALGLNVVVGYAGLLDLGYVAFYGIGAYTFALLSSPQLGIHLPSELAIPLAVGVAATFGYLLGLPSRRLLGDYLAIVTLFFAQMFVQALIHLDRLYLPWGTERINVTGGPNGIIGVHPITLFGFELSSLTRSYYFGLVCFTLLAIGLHRVHRSRIGRAWRAVREGPIAAESMGLPVNRLKILAFVVGSGTAGLAGTLFASVQISVFPQNFEVILLIMIYAAVVLGGLGSLTGVVLGGIVMAVFPEILRSPDHARVLLYAGLLLGLVAFLRPWWRLAAVAAGTIVLGMVIRILAPAEWATGQLGGGLWTLIDAWMITPPASFVVGNAAFVVLIAGVIVLTQVGPTPRSVLLPVVLYLGIFVWETRLLLEPSVTRQLVLGAVLVVMMAVRPQGLFGQHRVEIA